MLRWVVLLTERGDAAVLDTLDKLMEAKPQITALAPDIVAAILDDALPNDITLFELAVDPAAL